MRTSSSHTQLNEEYVQLSSHIYKLGGILEKKQTA
jgi:hypothetical protein